MGLTAVVGATISAARHSGDIGGYGLICSVGGIAYVASLFVLQRRG